MKSYSIEILCEPMGLILMVLALICGMYMVWISFVIVAISLMLWNEIEVEE